MAKVAYFGDAQGNVKTTSKWFYTEIYCENGYLQAVRNKIEKNGKWDPITFFF